MVQITIYFNVLVDANLDTIQCESSLFQLTMYAVSQPLPFVVSISEMEKLEDRIDDLEDSNIVLRGPSY